MTPDRHDAAIDPVCGMTVDPETTELRSEHHGTLYYFCAAGCKKAFDADPEKFIHAESSHQHHGHHH